MEIFQKDVYAWTLARPRNFAQPLTGMGSSQFVMPLN